MITDQAEIVNRFNAYFTNIGLNLSGKIKLGEGSHLELQGQRGQSQLQSMFILPTENEVKLIVRNCHPIKLQVIICQGCYQ